MMEFWEHYEKNKNQLFVFLFLNNQKRSVFPLAFDLRLKLKIKNCIYYVNACEYAYVHIWGGVTKYGECLK